MKYDYAIVGGGASGLMLGALADLNKCKAKGVIFEATAKLGSKLIMSGGGHCNITHAGSIKDFLSAYGDAGKFLRKALYKHNNLELVKWLEEDMQIFTDDSGRIFPSSMKSKDILDFLMRRVKANGWEIKTETKITNLEEIDAENIVIASGGITYPKTGSDGSVFKLLEEQGVSIVPPRSALAPIIIKNYPYEDLAGISLSNVTVEVFTESKPIRMQGDILFTHEGFSGPVILNLSKYAREGCMIRLNYGRSLEELPKRLQKSLTDRARNNIGEIKTKLLSTLLSDDRFEVGSIDSRGMVTAGGISLNEIDPLTMEVRPHLYAIGEAINVDGFTGGYNLQMCYSTAASVADVIMKERLENEV